jgi:hypothetical protein
MIKNHIPKTVKCDGAPPNPPKSGSGVKPPPALSPMQYMVVSDRWDGKGKEPIGRVGQLLTFLAADHGWEVIAVTGPYSDGHTEYLVARRRPHDPINQDDLDKTREQFIKLHTPVSWWSNLFRSGSR